MPSSGWPTQNKLNGSFADFCTFLTHAVLFSFFFILSYCVCLCAHVRMLSFFAFICV